MRIITFASSSSGNCALVNHGDTHILIDAGISMRQIVNGLGSFGLKPSDLDGIFITHEHSDHIKGLGNFLKYHGTPVFTTRTVANHLRWTISGADERLTELHPGEEFDIGGLSVKPFRTPHDTPESVGYVIRGDVTLGFCTDLGHVTEEVAESLEGADTVLLESNHDPDMLRYGSYPAYIKRRILSDSGHLSNEDCAKLAVRLVEGGTKTLILGHLSRKNNTPELARETVLGELEAGGFVIGRDYELLTAGADQALAAEVTGCRRTAGHKR